MKPESRIVARATRMLAVAAVGWAATAASPTASAQGGCISPRADPGYCDRASEREVQGLSCSEREAASEGCRFRDELARAGAEAGRRADALAGELDAVRDRADDAGARVDRLRSKVDAGRGRVSTLV